MTRHFLMYFAFTLSTSLTQCSKTTVDPNGLPPETQTGAGTFACLINGAVWQYKNADNFYTTPKTRWEFDPNSYGGLLYIGGIRYKDGVSADDILTIVVDSLNFKKEFTKGKTPYWGLNYINHKSQKRSCMELSSDSIYDNSKNFYSSGNLSISRFDQISKIISGTFNCTIFQPLCGDTLKITDGRFDLKYQ